MIELIKLIKLNELIELSEFRKFRLVRFFAACCHGIKSCLSYDKNDFHITGLFL